MTVPSYGAGVRVGELPWCQGLRARLAQRCPRQWDAPGDTVALGIPQLPASVRNSLFSSSAVLGSPGRALCAVTSLL